MLAMQRCGEKGLLRGVVRGLVVRSGVGAPPPLSASNRRRETSGRDYDWQQRHVAPGAARWTVSAGWYALSESRRITDGLACA
jgi:hypothetical protein